ncbi:hypothetical protein Csa_001415, partial [Cucumis sativus]
AKAKAELSDVEVMLKSRQLSILRSRSLKFKQRFKVKVEVDQTEVTNVELETTNA